MFVLSKFSAEILAFTPNALSSRATPRDLLPLVIPTPPCHFERSREISSSLRTNPQKRPVSEAECPIFVIIR